MKLTNLIYNLRNNISPYESFMIYNGNDWKKYVIYTNGEIPCPTILWRSTHMKLVLYGWKKHQSLYKNTVYLSTIKLLDGSLYSSILETDKKLSYKIVDTSQSLQVHPFSSCMITSTEQSTSLHLYNL
jgi:hypothetical protein